MGFAAILARSRLVASACASRMFLFPEGVAFCLLCHLGTAKASCQLSNPPKPDSRSCRYFKGACFIDGFHDALVLRPIIVTAH